MIRLILALVLLAPPSLSMPGDFAVRRALPCCHPRATAVRLAVDALAPQGWEVSYASPELGVVSASLASGRASRTVLSLSVTDSARVTLYDLLVTGGSPIQRSPDEDVVAATVAALRPLGDCSSPERP